jgi:hypothetical protein
MIPMTIATTTFLVGASLLVGCAPAVPEARFAGHDRTESAVAAPVAPHAGRAPIGAAGHVLAKKEPGAIVLWVESPDGGRPTEAARISARHVIGELALAVNGDQALVAWAQGEPAGCTSLFGFVWRLGESPQEVRRIGPRCDEETSARSPLAAASSDGGFVITFVELGVWSSSRARLAIDSDALRHASLDLPIGP